MKHENAGQVLDAVLMLQQATQRLQQNRTLVNALMNGDAPYTAAEQEEENINTSVNFLEGSRICMNATNQVNRHFFGSDRFFTLVYNKGPVAQRRRIGDVTTKIVNKMLKRDRRYRYARESAHAQVVLHGPGAVMWKDDRTPLPSTTGIEDVLIPSGTFLDMSNLDTFAVYRELTFKQLRAAMREGSDKGWNRGYAKALMASLYGQGFMPIYQGNRWLFPEKIQEDAKEGAINTYSSSAPKILAWDYFTVNEDSGKWDRKMVLDYGTLEEANVKGNAMKPENRQVLYTRENYADDWDEIVHWYVGNCSNVAPTRFHSIRSVGYLLYGVCALQNKLRCRLSDAVFQNMLTLFRNVSEDNREKLGLIDLQNFGIVPDGVSFVQSAERHVVDWNLVLMQMNQNRQLMAESSSGFIPDMQGALGGEGREMTATETLVRQNTSITLTNAVLGQLGDQSQFEYDEIWRRFCIKSSQDEMVKTLVEELRKEGISRDVLDFECWTVMPEASLGSGNKAVELTVTQALMQEVYPLVDPAAQRIILRRRYMALTDNPDEALAVVPETPGEGAKDDVQYAQFAATVLLQGLPFEDKEGVSHQTMAAVLMQVAATNVQAAQMIVGQPDGVGIAAQKIAGAANVMAHAQQEIAKVAQSDLMREQAKALMKQWDTINKALVEAAKAVQAAGEQQAPMSDAEAEQAKLQVKLQEMQATGAMQRQIAGENADQKRQQQQAKWSEENNRRNADTVAEIERKNATTQVDLRNSIVKTQAEVAMNRAKEASKPASGGGK